MPNHLDMSLDDIIKRTKSGRGRGRGRNYRGGIVRGGGPFTGVRRTGPIHRARLGVNARPSSYTIAKTIRKTKSFPWQTDLLEDSLRASGIPGLERGTKLYVSNLDYGVSNEDIRELFSEIGELRRYAIHYNKNGHSTGSAEVVYVTRSAAFAALKRYNNVQLDGKPLKIEIIGNDSKAPVSARVNVIGGFNGRRTVVMRSGMAPPRGPPAVFRGSNQRNRGGSMMGRGRGRGGGRGSVRGGRGGKTYRVDKSADDLDKELDNYHAEAMQT